MHTATKTPVRKRPVLLSWSCGKDSAWALHVLRQRDDIEVAGLFTTVNQEYHRVAMHAVREELVQQQASAAGLPLQILRIPNPCSNEEYERVMRSFVERARWQGITAMAFGDLYLRDVREYRQRNLAGTGIEPLFPLWDTPTVELAREMIRAGVKAVATCIDPRKIPANLAGRHFDRAFLDALPAGTDPCAENGEFHTFVYDGPCFREPLNIEVGPTVKRDGFVFTDVLPARP